MYILIILVLILLFEIYLLNRILKYFILSPVYLYLTFSLLSIVLTLGYFYFFENKFSFYNLDIVSESTFLETIKWYIIALISFILGVILYYDLSVKKTKKTFNRSFTEKLFFKYPFSKKMTYLAGVIFFVIIILYLVVYGKGILIRNEYISDDRSKPLVIIMKLLSFVEIILLGLIYHKEKVISSIYFFFFMLLFIGTGSRTVFLFFVLYALLVFISSGNTLFNKIRFSIHLVISLILLSYVMTLRGLEMHGIIPYLESIGTSSVSFYRSFLSNIYYSFIFGVFVTIKTVQEAQLDWNIILVNINPLPGVMAGWYDYADKMRINKFAPYSLHGRVFRTGIIFTIIYFFVTGLIFSFFEKRIRNLLNNNNIILPFILIILLSLHIVYAFEYNMRSAVRYFYYAFFVLLVPKIIKILISHLPRKTKI